MKLSLEWLKDFVALPEDLTMKQLAYDLTMRTVEVEGYEDLSERFEGIVVGIIESVDSHPQADKLRVCSVNVGEGDKLQIVCGGSNLYVNQKVAVAVPGSMVRWHGEGEPVEIKPTELRGVASQGMICGASEIGLELLFPVEDEREILDVTDMDCKAGDNLAHALGIHDFTLEIDNKSMTNRPDLWGHYGMARELAAIYQLPLKELPQIPSFDALEGYPVAIASESCFRYSALVYDNLKVEASPFWMQKRLWAVEQRPLNNLVDITNYVMMTTGQPTHGFDRRHVENGISVRQARANEKLQLLDGTDLLLHEEDMLITNQDKAIALAGVMGGKEDSILADTDSMVLELASFYGRSVRRTCQRHHLRTEASVRFEKNIDTQRIEDAIALSHYYIQELIPNSILKGFGEVRKNETKAEEVHVSLNFLSSRIGHEITFDVLQENIHPLGFTLESINDDEVRIQVPHWRSTGDVSLPDDILEELARMIGYENFDYVAPTVKIDGYVKQNDYDLKRKVMEYLSYRCNFQEIYTYPWVHDHFIEASGLSTENWVQLDQAPSPEEKHVRGSMLPSMIEAISKNIRYYESFRIFEMAQVFQKGEYSPSDKSEVLPLQHKELVAAWVGDDAIRMYREAKGVVENLGRYCSAEDLHITKSEKAVWADPKMYVSILTSDNKVIGELGLLSLQTSAKASIKNVYSIILLLNVDELKALDSRENVYEPLAQYPEVWQDLNIVAPENLEWAAIEASVSDFVHRMEFIEEYRGSQVPEGHKSVIFRYWLRSDEKTLSSDEIDQKMHDIIQRLEERLSVKIRQ